MTEPDDPAAPAAPNRPPVGTVRPRRRRRPAPDALDAVGSGHFFGGWIGAVMEFLTLRRVRRRIQESRRRRGDRVREAAAARRDT